MLLFMGLKKKKRKEKKEKTGNAAPRKTEIAWRTFNITSSLHPQTKNLGSFYTEISVFNDVSLSHVSNCRQGKKYVDLRHVASLPSHIHTQNVYPTFNMVLTRKKYKDKIWKFLDKTKSNKTIGFVLKKEMEKNFVSKFSKEETWR